MEIFNCFRGILTARFEHCVQLVLSYELVGGDERLTQQVKFLFRKLIAPGRFDQPIHILVSEAAVAVLTVGLYLNRTLSGIRIHDFHGFAMHD